jgi:hypothetical protein
MPVKNKILKFIRVKRQVDNFNVIYYVCKENSRNIVYGNTAYDSYKPLPTSEYFGAEFDIKPTQSDSFFDKKEKPLDEGRYTITFKILHDNNETILEKTFGVLRIDNKTNMTWLSDRMIR